MHGALYPNARRCLQAKLTSFQRDLVPNVVNIVFTRAAALRGSNPRAVISPQPRNHFLVLYMHLS